MRIKPTKAEALCLVIGLVIGTVAWLLLRPRRTATPAITVVVPYDAHRDSLILKGDSSSRAVTIIQQRTHQTLKTYEATRHRFDSLTVHLP
ncbi:hypothetical protein [Larkinella soli]|uniref:hypothetical protein n=1 Tax=Larkinella soli TaxID=1770527 RepID=UPI000FFC11BD|nr:hypothetical protein [Larkinella soli]